jgi:hypothetical protein
VIATIVLLLVVSLFLTGGGFAGGWFLKPHPLRGKLIMVGRRPSGGTALIRAVKPVRGVIEHTEKGDHKQDIHLDNAFLWEDRLNKCKVVDVDLDSGHPIRYTGDCKDDAEKVTIKRKDGTSVELQYLWRRLTGERLYQIRKDTRLKQLAAIGTGMWDLLTKVVPLALVIIGIVLVIMAIVMGVSMAKG